MHDRHVDLLIVDDNEDDAALVVRQFVKAGYVVDFLCVDTHAGMEGALRSGAWHAVISDMTMPNFSATAALDLYHRFGRDVPFLVVSGVVDEENAVALLKAGAHDFLSKAKLARLVPAFERERRETEMRQAHRQAEEALRRSEERYALASQGANDGLWDWNLLTGSAYYSPRWGEMLGFAPGQLPPTAAAWLERIHPDDTDTVRQAINAHLEGRLPNLAVEHRLRDAEGGYRWVLARGIAVTDGRGVPSRMAGSLTDITAAKVSELRLRETNAKLESAIAAKTRFLAAASHDMRQPIQALYCFAALLTHHVGGNESAKATLEDLENSLTSLKELLDTLLDVSKLDAGLVTPVAAPFPVMDVLERVVTEMTPLARAKGLKLRLVPSPAIVQSDPALLTRILRNLIENAIRYTDAGGVLVGCRRRGGRVRMEVWDTGVGISDQHRDMIFEEFFQVGNPERDRRKGLGLGLAIVSRLAHLLHHGIDLSSRPGRGSVFAIELPGGTCASVAPPASEGTSEPGPGHGDGHWVVVIDDEAMVAGALAGVIRSWGLDVAVASSVEEAVKRTRALAAIAGPPGAVVADYRLRDGRTGIQAIEAIRSLCGRTIPSVVVTGDTAADRLTEISVDNAAILHKPVPPGELRRTLAAYLGELAG